MKINHLESMFRELKSFSRSIAKGYMLNKQLPTYPKYKDYPQLKVTAFEVVGREIGESFYLFFHPYHNFKKALNN